MSIIYSWQRLWLPTGAADLPRGLPPKRFLFSSFSLASSASTVVPVVRWLLAAAFMS